MRSARAPIRIDVLRDAAAWQEHAVAWDAAALRSHSFALGFDWLSAWWDAFGGGRLNIAVVREGERVVALAPWRRTSERWLRRMPIRVVESLFNVHAACSDVFVDQGSATLAEHLLEALDDEPWDLLRLRCVPLRSPGVSALRAAAGTRGLAAHARPLQDSPFIVVSGSWQAFLAGRSSRLRKNLRHKRNRLNGEGVDARYACLTAPQQLEAELPELMELALRSWKGRAGSSIASPAERPFYEPVLRRLARAGLLRLWTLRLDGRLAAYEMHVHWGRRVAIPKAGYDSAFAHLAPGSLLEAHALEHLFEPAGCERVDLLGLDEEYKRRWTDDIDRYVDVFVFNRSLRARLMQMAEFTLRPPLGALKRRLRRQA